LAFAALFILRFNLTSVAGHWKRLTTDKAALWEVTPTPDEDIEVRLSFRPGTDIRVQWNVVISDSDKAMPVAAEDIE
jgi:hypothetical protein